MPDWIVSLLFLLATVGLFYANQALYRKHKRVWLIPAIPTSLLLILLVELTSTSYPLYFKDAHWLVWLLGPATVSFALPIYQNRLLIQKYWLALCLGSIAGIVVSIGVTHTLASLLNLDSDIARSLLARSVSTPFALEATLHLGGTAQLTGVFVVITGLFGIVLGEVILTLLPLRSRVARGAPLGTAAHGFGLSIARTAGAQEGAVASLTMIFSGVLMVVLSPVIAMVLG
ncbi:LrgB family protein [Pseudomonas syringae]|uniref:LrgB-like protein n=1 Tax=Pseudomonas syringae pv. aceris TaxID=199198 RepID=A0A0L8IPX7_PSESX|nr:LrgB family protein [Pseudomonas syringae]EGH71551.1 LrgB-like protein [Pseudomonas syringae pv. aceris str. M302273]KOG03486.1 LrgB-like protein [Pseudomonas syringae pv. aceris]KPW09180.1 LrgB-like protein [Pseudomonas syringae pv. aceris]